MKIDPNRTVDLLGSINYESAGKALERVVGLWKKDKKKEVFLVVSCSGGMVDPSFMLIDMIVALGINVTTIASGSVGSMGVLIFAVGKKRMATRHTDFFFHDLGCSFDKETRLTLGQMQIKTRNLAVSQSWYIDFLFEKTNRKFPRKKILELMEKETYLLPEEAKKYGLVHEVI